MLAEGEPAIPFCLLDQDGHPATLAELAGSVVVLYFYPKDDTPGCTREACAFRDQFAGFQQAGAQVLGVSPDTTAAHRRFADKYVLPFRLLADPDRAVCRAYGVWKEKNLYGRKVLGVERTTFVIDRAGVVRRVFRKVRVDGHAAAVLKAVREL